MQAFAKQALKQYFSSMVRYVKYEGFLPFLPPLVGLTGLPLEARRLRRRLHEFCVRHRLQRRCTRGKLCHPLAAREARIASPLVVSNQRANDEKRAGK